MLRKLLKYEFKATARTFIPIYIAIVLVAVVNRLVRLTSSKLVLNLTSMVLGSLFAALGVLTIIMIIQRFKKNLLSDEGYLMFTLPVGSKKLIMSKMITAIVWTIASGIVAMLTAVILVADQAFFASLPNFIPDLIRFITQDFKMTKDIGIALEVLFAMPVGYIGFILTVYVSLAAAQLPKLNKHRGIMSFVVFFIITTAIQWIGVICAQMFYPKIITDELIIMTIALISGIVLDILLFFGTDFILRKHLNLE